MKIILLYKKNTLILFSLLISNLVIFAQVGIDTETPNPSAILELKSENLGFLPPRIKLKSNTDIITIPNPNIGLMVYNLIPKTNETGLLYNGMVVWNSTEWRTLSNLSLDEKEI